MKAKKSLGQHFLKSDEALSSIVSAAEIKKGELVVEIGPGMGALTSVLLQAGAKVLAIETDERMINFLKKKFISSIESGELILLHKDIRNFCVQDILNYSKSYKVVANIPYYITGEIIRNFLESDFQPEEMVLLVQKEVAERMVAADGKQSLLSLSVAIYGNARIVSIVGREHFDPSPEVDSAVIQILGISKEKLKEVREKKFFSLIKRSFAHKRKTLLNNFSKEESEEIKKFLMKKGLPPNVRAESLSLETWISMTEEVSL